MGSFFMPSINQRQCAMGTIDRFSTKLNTAIKYMSAFLIGAMSILVFLQVIFRYVLNAPLDWSEEMASFSFVWMALLGASIGLKKKEHPNLDIFYKLFPGRVKKLADLVINLAITLPLAILCFYGVKLTILMRMQCTAALRYSVSYVYIVLPASAFIMLTYIIIDTLRIFRKEKEAEKKQ